MAPCDAHVQKELTHYLDAYLHLITPEKIGLNKLTNAEWTIDCGSCRRDVFERSYQDICSVWHFVQLRQRPWTN